MNKTIYWRVFVNSKDMDKAKRICNAFTLCIAGRCQLRKCEKYWKDKNLIEVEIVQEMNVPSTQQLLIDLFKILGRLSTEWNINVPSDISEHRLELSGTTDKIKLVGITWIGFDVER